MLKKPWFSSAANGYALTTLAILSFAHTTPSFANVTEEDLNGEYVCNSAPLRPKWNSFSGTLTLQDGKATLSLEQVGKDGLPVTTIHEGFVTVGKGEAGTRISGRSLVELSLEGAISSWKVSHPVNGTFGYLSLDVPMPAHPGSVTNISCNINN